MPVANIYTPQDPDPYLEVEGDERENKCLEVLHKVVEDSETFRVC